MARWSVVVIVPGEQRWQHRNGTDGCGIGASLAALSDDQRGEVERALKDAGWSNPKIKKLIEGFGAYATTFTVRRHRVGECSCGSGEFGRYDRGPGSGCGAHGMEGWPEFAAFREEWWRKRGGHDPDPRHERFLQQAFKRVPAEKLARHLREYGRSVSAWVIQQHRNGRCSCGS